MDYNKVLIIGRLGVDPELKTSVNGGQSMTFSLANTIYTKNQQTGDIVPRTIWHKINIWGDKLIQKCLTISKGDSVLVEGYLDYINIKKDNSQTETEVTIAKVIVSYYKHGRIEVVQRKGEKISDENSSYKSNNPSSNPNNFYGNKSPKERKDSSDFLEEDGF